MTEKALALRLAEWCDAFGHRRYDEIADELRRLHAVNTKLLEALKQIADIPNEDWGGDWDEIEEARLIARAAIAKAEGRE